MTGAFKEGDIPAIPSSFWDVNPDTLSPDLIQARLKAERILGVLGNEKRVWKSFMHATPEQVKLGQQIGNEIIKSPLAEQLLSPLRHNDFQFVVADSFEYSPQGDVLVKEPDGRRKDAYLICTKEIDLASRPSYTTSDSKRKVLDISLMSKVHDEICQVKVNGKVYDTRYGMDRSAYESMVFGSLTQGNTPPDTDDNSYTFLTAMLADSAMIYYASVHKDSSPAQPRWQPYFGREKIDYPWQWHSKFNFRPAIKLEPI